jgi:hypothetical protein
MPHLTTTTCASPGEEWRVGLETVVVALARVGSIFLTHERLCVIKFYAPFCKAVTSFVVSFVNLHLKLCKHIDKTFPSVITFRGGDDTSCSTTIEHGVR